MDSEFENMISISFQLIVKGVVQIGNESIYWKIIVISDEFKLYINQEVLNKFKNEKHCYLIFKPLNKDIEKQPVFIFFFRNFF